MKFSIITAVKNNKAGLLRAIESVRSQTYQNVEHIIIDGGSTDGTVEAIKNEQLKIKNLSKPNTRYSLLSISETDSGIYDAINKGIKLATGDVIGLLHSDDLYADENVITRYENGFNDQKVDSVYSDLVYVKFRQEARSKESEVGDQSSKFKDLASIQSYNHSIIRYWKAGDLSTKFILEKVGLRITKVLKYGWMPPHPTLFIRKEIFERYGLYDTSFKIAADYEMILRLFYKHKITTHYLPLTTYLMSVGGASNKSIKNVLLKSKEDLLALKLHELPHPLLTLLSKNFRKLPQFLVRDLS